VRLHIASATAATLGSCLRNERKFTVKGPNRAAEPGATGAVLDRSLDGLRSLVDRALADVRRTRSRLQAG
jgi:hypothetical protein